MISFTCTGHENLLGTHRNTFEFTTDDYLTKKGDCIIGINASTIPQAMKGTIKITIQSENYTEEITAEANPDFSSDHEMVIRLSEYLDARTYAINASKSAKFINRDLINELKSQDAQLTITVASCE